MGNQSIYRLSLKLMTAAMVLHSGRRNYNPVGQSHCLGKTVTLWCYPHTVLNHIVLLVIILFSLIDRLGLFLIHWIKMLKILKHF